MAKTYEIEILESSQKLVQVEAESEDEARMKVEEMHRKEEVVLTADDFIGTDFTVVGEVVNGIVQSEK